MEHEKSHNKLGKKKGITFLSTILKPQSESIMIDGVNTAEGIGREKTAAKSPFLPNNENLNNNLSLSLSLSLKKKWDQRSLLLTNSKIKP